jgi:Sec-independent protein secretion pathway component TatC
MLILWLVLAGAMALLYLYLEWTITNNTAKGIMRQEKVILPGKKLHYVIAGAVIAFVGITAAYFALLTYLGADVQFGCWLGVGLLVSGIVAIGTYARLRYASFQKDDE